MFARFVGMFPPAKFLAFDKALSTVVGIERE